MAPQSGKRRRGKRRTENLGCEDTPYPSGKNRGKIVQESIAKGEKKKFLSRQKQETLQRKREKETLEDGLLLNSILNRLFERGTKIIPVQPGNGRLIQKNGCQQNQKMPWKGWIKVGSSRVEGP